MPRSRVGIFRNERTRSTPLASKLTFWCVSYSLDAFGTIWLPYKTRCKTGRSGATVRAMKSCRNFSQRMHPIHPIGPLPPVSVCFVLCGCIWVSLLHYCKSSCHEGASVSFATNTPDQPHLTLNSCFGVFHTIWMHLGQFGCLTKLSAKRAEVVQKFVPRSRVLIFHNKHTRLAPLGTKLMFWCILYYLGVFGTIWLPYKTRCKTGQSGAKVRATKSRHNFSQQTHRIDPVRT